MERCRSGLVSPVTKPQEVTMKISLAVLALAAFSLSPALAQDAAAPTTQPPAAASDTASDMTSVTSPQDFADKAGVANMFEIESSKAALEKASSDDVKTFAQKMVDDHTKAGEAMKTAADSQGGITVPTELDDAHQQMLDQLNGASGADFDTLYIQMQTDAHKQAVALFDAFSKNGEDGALKDFAGKTLPTLQEHYEMVQKLGSASGGGDQGAMAPAPATDANASNGANAGSAAPADNNTAAPAADNSAAAPAADNNAAAPADNATPAAPATPMAPAPDASAPADNSTAATQNQAAGIDVSALTPLDLTTLKGDDLKGMDVLDPQGEKIASINDFVLTDDGKIDAVIVDFGGFLGIGTKQVALGFEGLDFVGDENGNRYLVVNVTKDQLDAQPAYNKDEYAASRDTQLLNVSK
jgi:putative membrane protein